MLSLFTAFINWNVLGHFYLLISFPWPIKLLKASVYCDLKIPKLNDNVICCRIWMLLRRLFKVLCYSKEAFSWYVILTILFDLGSPKQCFYIFELIDVYTLASESWWAPHLWKHGGTMGCIWRKSDTIPWHISRI